jgi:signal transduction histidine kinase
MNGNGRISVATDAVKNTPIEITVRDSGPGIAPGHLPRLLEPFFTTKPAGQGTGLGLAICNEIIAEHGGTLRADNHPEGGACFSIILPAHQRST